MKHKIRGWIKRYLPGEIICAITALLAATAAYFLTGNRVVIAYAGTWGENLGFYGFMSIRDIIHSRRHHKANNLKYGVNSFIKTFRNLLLEFGFSEVLDSFLIRPFFMYIFPFIVGNIALGVLIGKIAADITFYIPTVIAYELRKRHLK